MKNHEVADIFERMGRLLEIKGDNIFKVRAYLKAAENIRLSGEDVAVLCREHRLKEIGGLGSALQEKINEFLATGKVAAYDKLTDEVPENLLDLVDIPSVGPKKAGLFFKRLHISRLEDLKKAAASGRLAKLPGIQDKTVEKILKGIAIVETSRRRMDLGRADRVADAFVSALKKLKPVKKISVAGSLRRMCEVVGDIDILAVADKPEAVMTAFVHLPGVKEIIAYGRTKSSIRTPENVQVDLRVVEARSFGAALVYFTGSKSFNVALRQAAMKKDMKVNEYGIFAVKDSGEKRLASGTEKACFRALGLPLIPPELREEIGLKELFSRKKPAIPDLVEAKDIRGDLHVHSSWSDGLDATGDLARAAVLRGYEYLGVTDHSAKLKVARGLSLEALREKRREIDRLNNRLKNIRILFGAEVEIDIKGNLDYNDKILAQFDIVIAAIHGGFEQSPETLTSRLVRACHNGHVDVLAHPLGIHAGKRRPMNIDFDTVCRAARDTGTILEVNAFPVRLDLDSPHVYYARRQDVRFMINTDAHRIDHLDFMRFGVGVARRGWLQAEDVVNTLPLNKFLKALK